METYTILREIADSWVLLAMFGFFVAVILWAFRPGSTAIYKSVSQIPLRDDEALSVNEKGNTDKGSTSLKGADHGEA
jgi:cytochrome c oxidase cbb3-type subunit 4